VKKQLLVAAIGFAVVAMLFFLGKTEAPKTKSAPASMPQTEVKAFDITAFITGIKQRITPAQNITLGKLENSVSRGDVKNQQIESNNQLAAYWKDSLHSFEPYIYYLSNAAKLDNSEKNLTFAAQLILESVKSEQDEAKLNWEAGLAIELFEQALQLNPESDNLKVGLGSCYI
jgi:hypothetical protein